MRLMTEISGYDLENGRDDDLADVKDP